MNTLDSTASPAWRPLTREQRRVVGVLVEKAKTTPDAYPLTLNAITTACNQKTNRHPLMDLTSDEVETALEALREMKAVTEIQGTGRVSKYRHNMYQWLGVEKVELAVMGELLLRGQQTVGELRGRAARMEPIADLQALKPIVSGLIARKLVVELSPPGRGQMVTHNLYQDRELDKLRESIGSDFVSDESESSSDDAAAPRAVENRQQVDTDFQSQLDQLRQQVSEILQRLERLES